MTTPGQTTLVMGGCRSGKSEFAQRLAEAAGGRRLFVATCQPVDDDMRARVRRHQAARGDSWDTVETPLEITDVILLNKQVYDVILIDCLTLWTTQLAMASTTDEMLLRRVSALTATFSAPGASLVMVSNEVGCGIVPENALARRFRDMAGLVNQRVAAATDRVVWVVAGIPVTIKGSSGGVL